MSANLVRGFVLEGDQPGNYYHRSGAWVQYSCPASGYVWSGTDIHAILEDYEENPEEWPISPAKAHPAIHDPSTGTTVLTGPAKTAKEVATRGEDLRTKKYTGGNFNLRVVSEGLSKDIVAMSVSL